jgi:hypothetical protein
VTASGAPSWLTSARNSEAIMSGCDGALSGRTMARGKLDSKLAFRGAAGFESCVEQSLWIPILRISAQEPPYAIVLDLRRGRSARIVCTLQAQTSMTPTCVYNSYWRFAAERHAIYERRLLDDSGPWTCDPILHSYRFTNVYRVADRVSQYLIREVQYRSDRDQTPEELFFRTLLFKIFNKIETWEMIESALGPVSWQRSDLNLITRILDEALRRGDKIYSAAYIMPSAPFGHQRKHSNHLALLAVMMDDGLPAKVQRARSLREVYDFIRVYPGLGSFLSFQYVVDLNYSNLLDFDEDDFVMAGPGALDGIAKCFSDLGGRAPEGVIFEMVDRQDREFTRLGLRFSGLYGRKLQPIDCQNVFCEISKYARVAFPEVRGLSGRKRIKQSYRPARRALNPPMFPPRWQLTVPMAISESLTVGQRSVFF